MKVTAPATENDDDEKTFDGKGLTHFIAIGQNGCWGKGMTEKSAILQMTRRSSYLEKKLRSLSCPQVDQS
jgi:hypothetical protein